MKNVTLPESMRVLQERFLNEHNIDAFLSQQDEDVLRYFHSSYDKNYQDIRQKVERSSIASSKFLEDSKI